MAAFVFMTVPMQECGSVYPRLPPSGDTRAHWNMHNLCIFWDKKDIAIFAANLYNKFIGKALEGFGSHRIIKMTLGASFENLSKTFISSGGSPLYKDIKDWKQ